MAKAKPDPTNTDSEQPSTPFAQPVPSPVAASIGSEPAPSGTEENMPLHLPASESTHRSGEYDVKSDAVSPTPSDTHRVTDNGEEDLLSSILPNNSRNCLAHYQLIQQLGEGSMGIVFIAQDLHLNRRVALKVMQEHSARNRHGKQRFLREARAMAAVKHENIVTVYQIGEDRGIPYMAMELLDGVPLNQYIKRFDSQIPVREALRIGREVASGLAAAHAVGLIHRDIKPANIFLEKPNHHVKILDFGLARMQSGEDLLTNPGSVMGTPAFMAPEQAQGKHLDCRADLFSLGSLIYWMLTGNLPFSGDTITAVFVALLMEAPPPLRSQIPDLPESIEQLVSYLMSKKAENRPATAEEAIERIREIEAELAGVGSSVLNRRMLLSPNSKQVEQPWDSLDSFQFPSKSELPTPVLAKEPRTSAEVDSLDQSLFNLNNLGEELSNDSLDHLSPASEPVDNLLEVPMVEEAYKTESLLQKRRQQFSRWMFFGSFLGILLGGFLCFALIRMGLTPDSLFVRLKQQNLQPVPTPEPTSTQETLPQTSPTTEATASAAATATTNKAKATKPEATQTTTAATSTALDKVPTQPIPIPEPSPAPVPIPTPTEPGHGIRERFADTLRLMDPPVKPGVPVSAIPAGPPRAHWEQILDLSISSDGRWLASLGFEGMTRIWDLTKRDLNHTLPLTTRAQACSWQPQSNILWVCQAMDQQSKLEPWNAISGEPIVSEAVKPIKVPCTYHQFLTQSNQKLRYFGIDQGKQLFYLNLPFEDGHLKVSQLVPSTASNFAISVDGKVLAWFDHTDQQLHLDTEQISSVLPDYLVEFGKCQQLKFSTQGNYLAAVTMDDQLLVWELEPTQPSKLILKEANYRDADFAEHGQYLAGLHAKDNSIGLWRLPDKQFWSLRSHSVDVTALTWDQTGKTLVSGDWWGTIGVWSLTELPKTGGPWQRCQRLRPDTTPPVCCQFASRDRYFDWVDSQTIYRLDLTSNSKRPLAIPVQADIRRGDFAKTGQWLALEVLEGNDTHGLQIWDLQAATPQNTTIIPIDPKTTIVHWRSFTPNGRALLLATTRQEANQSKNYLECCETLTGRELWRFELLHFIWSGAFNPSGDRLALFDNQMQLLFYNIQSDWNNPPSRSEPWTKWANHESQTDQNQHQEVFALHVEWVEPNELVLYRRLLQSQDLVQLNPNTLKCSEAWAFLKPEPQCSHFATSPKLTNNRRLLAAAGVSGQIHLWELPTGKTLTCYQLGPMIGRILHVAFSNDGRYLAACLFNGTVVLLDLSLDESLQPIIDAGTS